MSSKRQTVMPPASPEGIVPTLNDYGSTSLAVHEYAQKFVELASASPHWVMDVGCAYGAPVVAAITGGARVIANDLDARHLRIVRGQIPPALSLNLRTRKGAFPRMRLPSACLGAINCSAVLHFMDGGTVDASASEMHRLLVPGGRVFILTMTPFLQYLQSFVPQFEQRKAANERFPGYIDDIYAMLGRGSTDENKPKRHLNLFDTDVLIRVFADAGFVVETAEYAKNINASISIDGRGAVALIARKS